MLTLTRSILAPTNAQVDNYNSRILAKFEGERRFYSDCLKEADDNGLDTHESVLQYVATHTPPGMPPHTLCIKRHGVYRLLRNFSIDRGLVKNARVYISDLGDRLITVQLFETTTGA